MRMWDESREAQMWGLTHDEEEDEEEETTVPAEPVKPVIKAILASRGAMYSLW